ncbi:hypothetical protein CC86DRAFT_466647 [Ophiobolus disseminans]|uniref:Uncharacterized protein n=1 Tax=Ophiobolus disseminans TaxID=1469910 RepID=A0A6A7A160_9PLEO|nr:hypothetical protein CC86DRAFT_466647 [Ophiobolus disseminans]
MTQNADSEVSDDPTSVLADLTTKFAGTTLNDTPAKTKRIILPVRSVTKTSRSSQFNTPQKHVCIEEARHECRVGSIAQVPSLSDISSDQDLSLQGIDEEGNTALILASAAATPFGSSVAILSNLLSNGADINARNRRGRTALMEAAFRGKFHNVNLLLDDKWEVKVDVDMRDDKGLRAIDFATDDMKWKEERRRRCNESPELLKQGPLDDSLRELVETRLRMESTRTKKLFVGKKNDSVLAMPSAATRTCETEIVTNVALPQEVNLPRQSVGDEGCQSSPVVSLLSFEEQLAGMNKVIQEQTKLLQRVELSLKEYSAQRGILEDIRADTARNRAETEKIRAETAQIRADTQKLQGKTSEQLREWLAMFKETQATILLPRTDNAMDLINLCLDEVDVVPPSASETCQMTVLGVEEKRRLAGKLNTVLCKTALTLCASDVSAEPLLS